MVPLNLQMFNDVHRYFLSLSLKYISKTHQKTKQFPQHPLEPLGEIYRTRKLLGSYLVALEGEVDAIIFTGGVGETLGIIKGLFVIFFFFLCVFFLKGCLFFIVIYLKL